MSETSAVLAWRADLVSACGLRLHRIADELVRVLATLAGPLARPLRGCTWRGPGAARADLSVARRAGVIRRLADELATTGDTMTEGGHRIRAAQTAAETVLARARAEPMLEQEPLGHLSVRPLDALALLATGAAGGFETAGLEQLAHRLQAELDRSLAEAHRVDGAGAAALAALADAARSLLRTYEPAQVRADHARLLDASGLSSWLRAIPAIGSPPQDVADWWAAHLPAEQAGLIRAVTGMHPAAARLGSLDGLPLDVRDTVNRVALAHRCAGYADEIAHIDAELAFADGRAAALLVRELATVVAARRVDLAVRDQLRALDEARDEATGDRLRSLLLVDEPRAWGGVGRVAVSVGAADTAGHVAYVVPGFGVQPGPDLADQVRSARNVYDQARRFAPRGSVAVVAWLGYRTPGWTQVAFDTRARRGAVALARDLEGLRVARAQTPPHVTVIGHSYGSTTASLALRETTSHIDDAVFLGSPGLLARRASDLPVPPGHVWIGAASGDEVSHLSRFGVDPAARSFGGHRFPAECPPGTPLVAQHTAYLAAGSPSLRNVARIVAGLAAQVPTVPGRVDAGIMGELERLAAAGAGIPVLPELLGPAPGDPTFADPAR